MTGVRLASYVAAFARSPLAPWREAAPWELTSEASQIVSRLVATLVSDFVIERDVAIHRFAVVEPGATIKGPAIIGARCLVAAGAYLRGGVWLDAGCIIGPGSEVKSSFLFRDSKLAHFNFVGDSLLGERVNLEAGSIIANFRNEYDDKTIVAGRSEARIFTGVDKFGALIGDGCRIGANAVIAPGALLEPGRIVARLALIDQGRDGPHAGPD